MSSEPEPILLEARKPNPLLMLEFWVPALVTAGVLMAVGALLHLVLGVDFIWGPFFVGPLFAGLGVSFIRGILRKRDWVDRTPVYQHWKFLLGAKIAKPVLGVLMVLPVLAGIASVLVPPLMGKPRVSEKAFLNRPIGPGPGQPISRIQAKSQGLSPGDAGFFEAVKEDLDSSSPSRQSTGLSQAMTSLRLQNSPNRKELHDLLIELMRKGDRTTQMTIVGLLPEFGTEEDVDAVREIRAKYREPLVTKACEETIKKLRTKK